MGGIAIRPATPDDEAAVLDLIEELFASPGVPPGGYTRERGRKGFQYALKRDDAEILLAIAGSEPVGLASVYVDFQAIRYGLRCYLQDLVVTSVRRSEGIGALLLDASAAWARERGCDQFVLDSGNGRKDAHRFYAAHGMEQANLNFTQEIDPPP